MAKQKNGLMWAITLSLPILFFVLLEFGLRAAGYGKSVSLFIENPSAPQYMLPRPDVVKRYFSEEQAAPNVTIETNFFKSVKAENGLRVFVQGGSTAAGFPYGFGASIAGMLDYRLKQTFPNRDVEVVNTALSAVNSYTLLDFADEIIAQQPDAVLIYAGHNEYLGILGVGSAYTAANSQAATLMYLKLKDLRIFQLMQSVYAFFSSPEPQVKTNARTTMAKVAKHKNIPHGSELFQQGLSQFETNMKLLLDKYAKANIPVVISTIGSNLSHQAPFSSEPIPKEGRLILTKQVFNAEQLAEFEQLADNSSSAEFYYQIAQRYLSLGDATNAKRLFEQARQHDLLRFRAPNEINQIIEKLANEYALLLVDANKALEEVAPNGIIGKEHMIEHLHPTVAGYFEISNAFYESLQTSKLIGDFEQPVNKLNAKRELPIFAAEEYWGGAKIAGLVADYPFTDKPTEPIYEPIQNWSDQLGFDAYKNKADWLTIASKSLNMAKQQQDKVTAIKATKLISDAVPNNANFAFRAGVTLIELGRALEAPRYLKRVLELEPKHTNAMLALAHSYALQQKYMQALDWLEKVLVLEPNNKTALQIEPKIRRLINQT